MSRQPMDLADPRVDACIAACEDRPQTPAAHRARRVPLRRQRPRRMGGRDREPGVARHPGAGRRHRALLGIVGGADRGDGRRGRAHAVGRRPGHRTGRHRSRAARRHRPRDRRGVRRAHRHRQRRHQRPGGDSRRDRPRRPPGAVRGRRGRVACRGAVRHERSARERGARRVPEGPDGAAGPELRRGRRGGDDLLAQQPLRRATTGTGACARARSRTESFAARRRRACSPGWKPR